MKSNNSAQYLWLASAIFFGIIAIVGLLGGCAPVVWDRPGITTEQFAMDRARCQLTANAITPSAAPRDMGDAIANGITEGIQHGENFSLCMQANGYQRRQQ